MHLKTQFSIITYGREEALVLAELITHIFHRNKFVLGQLKHNSPQGFFFQIFFVSTHLLVLRFNCRYCLHWQGGKKSVLFKIPLISHLIKGVTSFDLSSTLLFTLKLKGNRLTKQKYYLALWGKFHHKHNVGLLRSSFLLNCLPRKSSP